MSLKILQDVITDVNSIMDTFEGGDREELSLLVKDLEDAKLTIFVKTADAKPFIERIRENADALKNAVESEDAREKEARQAFSSFERAVSKLRNTILIRTQKAT